MNTTNSSTGTERGPSRTKLSNRQLLKAVQISSRMVTLFFLAALVWAIYEAVANRNPLPTWAWLGMVVLFSATIGLGVAVVVYRGVAAQVGPFDYRPSSRVAGELKSEAKLLEIGEATRLRAEIKMTMGVLELSGGAEQALDASFIYDDADWKPPVVEYAVDDTGRGNLVVEQKTTGRPAMRQGQCEWVISLNPDLPTELDVRFGAGKAALRLGGMDLEDLRVESGVGELLLDLSGEWKRSLAVFIKAGIGDTTLILPQDAGVRIRSSVSMGSIQPYGLTWDGEAYTNALYGQTRVDLDVSLQGGIGKIRL